MNKLIPGAALLALSTGFAAAQTVRMGTEGAYPPYNFINDAGEVDGFERELGDELCTRAGLTCEWVTTDWDSIIPNLQSGNYYTIIAGMSITEPFFNRRYRLRVALPSSRDSTISASSSRASS